MSKKPPKGRSLAEVNPNLAKQWHPDNEQTAKDVFPKTDKKYFWKCPKGHKWEASTKSRSKGSDCTVCKTIAITHPHLAEEWHPTENDGKTAFEVKDKRHKKWWWKCSKGHKWDASTISRLSGSDCTVCRSIEITHPHLAEEWHPTFNGDKKPEDFTAGSHEKIWWKCREDPKAEEEKADDHVWYSEIKIRAIGNESGCPICVGKKVVPSNCLAITHHHLEKQWHPTFNGDKKPEDYTAGSHEKIWWKCREDPKADDHVWYSEIKSRTRGNKSGCPICINRREWPVPSTSLKKTHPKLAKEWHPTENIYKETGHFPIGKLEDLWRPCLYDENYEWKVTINARARLLKLYSHFDDDINPFLAKEWEPTKDKKPEHFTAGSNEKIWWKCRKGHKWPALIKSRTRTDKPTGCLECNPKSKEELQIFYELKSIWKDAVNGYKEEFDSGEFDFYIPKLYLVIDYDGNRWHNKKNNIERDRTKTNIFKLNKYNVFRIREQSNEFKLDNITDNDITIDKYQKNKIKTIVDRVLSNIMEMFPNELDAKEITRINEYIAKPGLRNSKKCDEELRRIYD